jgi:hypothetical protein
MTGDGRRRFESYVTRAKQQHGDRLDLSEIPAKFIPYFQTGQRIRVRMYGEEMTGTVSVTTGWRPALLLIRRANATGSSDLLRDDTEIVAEQHGRTYVPVANLYRNPNWTTGGVSA